MKYDELIQLYFERSNALQAYWTLYVFIVGGLLAFSSLRKLPAAVTTLIVTLLFCLFAYENMDAILTVTRQRHATLAAIKQSDPGSTVSEIKALRDLLEPTLTPAAESAVMRTHLVSDVLTVLGLWAMELRRRKNAGALSASSAPI
jgi:hypothetical protein